MAEKILVTRSSLPPLEEYVDEIRSIFESHWLTNMGEKHEALERELKRFLGVEQICLFQNGHLALEMSLQAMGISGEVITTPYTFASTTWAILRAGCTPVFCDIDPVTFTMDPEKIEDVYRKLTLIFTFTELNALDLDRAAAMKWSDFEDALQSVAAERLKADYIITRNVRDYLKSSVTALSPAEYLARRTFS